MTFAASLLHKAAEVWAIGNTHASSAQGTDPLLAIIPLSSRLSSLNPPQRPEPGSLTAAAPPGLEGRGNRVEPTA